MASVDGPSFPPSRVCVCVRARVCVRASLPPLCDIFPEIRLAPLPPSNHVGDKCEAVTSVLIGARACTQGCGRLHPSYTHTHTPHNPAGLLFHLKRQYNPTGLPVHSQGCSYNPTGLSVRSQAQSGIHTQSHCGVPVRSQGCTYNTTGLSVRSQAQSGIHPQSHWSPCTFTGIHLYSHEDPCAFTGVSSLKTPSQTPLEPILISVSQPAL